MRLAHQRDEERRHPVGHVQPVRRRRAAGQQQQPHEHLHDHRAWATRSSGQKTIDAAASLRSQPTTPQPAAIRFDASTPIPRPCESRSAGAPFRVLHYVAPPHKAALYIRVVVLKSYLPALVFLLLGNRHRHGLHARQQPARAEAARAGSRREPYESGLPSEVKKSFRFGISFYLIAMLFILFDIEVVFLYPVALQLEAFGVFALGETVVFVVLLLVAFVFVWRRGALEWK